MGKTTIAKSLHYFFDTIVHSEAENSFAATESLRDKWNAFEALSEKEKVDLLRLSVDFAVSASSALLTPSGNPWNREILFGQTSLPEGHLDQESVKEIEKKLRQWREEQIYLHSLFGEGEETLLLPEAMAFYLKFFTLTKIALSEFAKSLEKIAATKNSNYFYAASDDFRSIIAGMERHCTN